VSGPIQPEATVHGVRRPATPDQSKGWSGALTVRSPHTACVLDGVVAHSLAAGRWHGAVGELMGATGRASGKAIGGGAHLSGDMTWRRWRMLWVAVFIGGEGAPVASGDGGTTLQCRRERGKVRVASNGDNGGRWEGLAVKRQRRWRSDGNQRGGGALVAKAGEAGV
jgi:hypothetical protein